jgi:hypothetical protein
VVLGNKTNHIFAMVTQFGNKYTRYQYSVAIKVKTQPFVILLPLQIDENPGEWQPGEWHFVKKVSSHARNENKIQGVVIFTSAESSYRSNVMSNVIKYLIIRWISAGRRMTYCKNTPMNYS